jgi:hypothetical protein
MNSKLKTNIELILQKAEYPSGPKEIWFNWDEYSKTWCFSGTTIDGLFWETDDTEAEDLESAEEDAATYLEMWDEIDRY